MSPLALNIPASALPLVYLGALLVGAKVGEEAFRRLGLVPFVGAILFGIIVGPGLLNFIPLAPTISLFVSIGINFLLFLTGAQEFEASRLTRILKSRVTVPVGVSQFVIRFATITLVSYVLFQQPIPSVVIGVVAGMSSAGPLSRLLTDTGLARTDEGAAIFTQVTVIEIAAVILFSFVYDLAGRPVTIASVATIGIEMSVTLAAIVLFGRYVMVPLLERVERHARGREAVFAIMISLVLLAGFAGEATGFNSAVVALFLGLLTQNFLSSRPVMAEKLASFTYGFFEPLFFAGLGLYFVALTPVLLGLGVAIFAAALVLDAVVGAVSARVFKVDTWRNAFGTCVNGGVDAALLVSALTGRVALIGGYAYSAAAIGIALLSLTAPLLFRVRAQLVEVDQDLGIRRIVRQQLDNLVAEEISRTLPVISVPDTVPISVAVRTCVEKDVRAVVVVNKQGVPIGTMLLREVMTLSANEMSRTTVGEGPLASAVTVGRDEPALRLAGIFKRTNIPTMAVVDDDGKLVGTILEREILRRMVASLEEGPSPSH